MLFTFGVLLVGLIVITFIVSVLTGDNEETEMTKEEFMRCLNFMLQHNVINHIQYNDMLTKGIQFTRK
ncbi:MAG TPA: hypothetical protein VK142_05875 [Bacillota bacterium]|nr:hypothetical protein [Bacillota bacterium]